MKLMLNVWDLWSTGWPSFETVSVSFPLLAECTHTVSAAIPNHFFLVSLFLHPDLWGCVLSSCLREHTGLFSKHTQCSSFFPKSQKEKAPPDKINNPPTHTLKQTHQGRGDQLCAVPWRFPAWCLLQWRALSVSALPWAIQGRVWDSQTQQYVMPGSSLTPSPERQMFSTRAI